MLKVLRIREIKVKAVLCPEATEVALTDVLIRVKTCENCPHYRGGMIDKTVSCNYIRQSKGGGKNDD